MSIFHENHIADSKEANHILTAILGASTVVNQAYESFSMQSENEEQTRSRIIDDLQVMLAKLRGYRECNTLTDSFVSLHEEKLNAVKDHLSTPSADPKIDARAIQIVALALTSAVEIQQKKSQKINILYKVEMEMRQSAICTLARTLRFAMLGLKAYLIAIGFWCGYLLHTHGMKWKEAGPLVGLVVLFALVLLHRVADDAIKPARRTLNTLREQNARGQ